MTDLEKFEALKKLLTIDNSEVAEMFGYKNPKQLDGHNSSRGHKTKVGIVRIYEKIVEHLSLEELKEK